MMRRSPFFDWRRRGPGWLALFTLLIQLVGSFGHMHPEDFRFLQHGNAAPTLMAGDGPAGRSSPVLPADTDCPICASVLLLGSSALPDAVVLPLPQIATTSALFIGATLWLTPPRHLLFSTRGPPSV
jgi:hypothetical protein